MIGVTRSQLFQLSMKRAASATRRDGPGEPNSSLVFPRCRADAATGLKQPCIEWRQLCVSFDRQQRVYVGVRSETLMTTNRLKLSEGSSCSTTALALKRHSQLPCKPRTSYECTTRPRLDPRLAPPPPPPFFITFLKNPLGSCTEWRPRSCTTSSQHRTSTAPSKSRPKASRKTRPPRSNRSSQFPSLRDPH